MNFSAELKIHNIFHILKFCKHKEINEIKSKAHYSVKNVFKNNYKYVVKEFIDLKKRN